MGQVRRRGDAVRVSLSPAETGVLANLVSQVMALLGDADLPDVPGGAASEDPLERLLRWTPADEGVPEDPALARLLPAAYTGDAEAAGEFRRLTEGDLRTTKREGLRRVLTGLAALTPRGLRVELDGEPLADWLRALTDIRLALGTRLGIGHVDDVELDRRRMRQRDDFAVYDWLAWLQDSMVRAAAP